MIEKNINKIGDVIRIIDNRTLIINVGEEELKVGDLVKVYEPIDILYNSDGSELCEFEYTKDILEVIEVDRRYSICQKQETRSTVFSEMAISPLLSLQKKEYVPLDVDENEIKPLKEIIDGLFEDYKEAYLALEKEV